VNFDIDRHHPAGCRIELRAVATLAERARLDAWLSSAGNALDRSPGRRNAGGDVIRDLRINGVSVQARSPAWVPSRRKPRADVDRLARAEEVVRRDVPRSRKTRAANTATPLPKPVPHVPTDPGKRHRLAGSREPAYIVTADGSRYFVGSMLPPAQIMQIGCPSVKLERDGQETT